MSVSNILRRMLSPYRDESGAVAVEFGLIGGIFIVLLLAMIDLGHAFWQFNQATKALQLGVRLAAVSNPVSSDLKTMTGISGTVEEGDPMPYFKRVCSGATQRCDGGTYDAAAMRTIVYGRGNAACPTTPQAYPAMCQIFPRIQPQNLVVEYTQTGLGFAGRPGGPVPTITVRLTGLSFNFAVLNGLLGFPAIPMARLTATVSGEDLSGQ
ncbi:MAG TPA: TadE/TadG family type IV pilus assembly protein [Beijerinckiaceae bacterium]|nr:TadE/TadG family type IV pilus assembly protein [Beijerinckiaceae bacterium]